MANKERLAKLDGGQLDAMWNFLKLRKQCECTKQDVKLLREHCENIRIALTQKNAGQRKDGAKDMRTSRSYSTRLIVRRRRRLS